VEVRDSEGESFSSVSVLIVLLGITHPTRVCASHGVGKLVVFARAFAVTCRGVHIVGK